MSATIRDSVSKQIARSREDGSLTVDEEAILGLLEKNWNSGERITQNQIAKTEAWMGCHPEHEQHIRANNLETTTRRVRQIIRDIRIKHRIPILSDDGGYYLPTFQNDAQSYLSRMEREAKARAKASIETYLIMKDSLGIQSDFFDALSV